jgi:hypothetical protein
VKRYETIHLGYGYMRSADGSINLMFPVDVQ